jgi:hypothetical protein
MPSFGENVPEASTDVEPRVNAGAAISASFCFVPRELAIQCRQLIESYHTLYGDVGPAGLLELADTRDIIDGHRNCFPGTRSCIDQKPTILPINY